MITSTQIRNLEIFAFMAVLVFKFLGRKVLFINRKDNRNLKSRLLFKKIANFTGKLLKNYKWDAKFINLSDHLSFLFQFA